ncbi:MAG: hypothetical protein M1549_01910 [Candidatus Dependentiae bacterium]|nr:hypothetical protein [Candidatus Dependentiae bacterium]
MKRICTVLIAVLLSAPLARAGQPSIKEQELRATAHLTCLLQDQALARVIRYVRQSKLANRGDIEYQLNVLRSCTTDDITRVHECSLNELRSMLLAAELIVENFDEKIPANPEQVCTGRPVVASGDELKSMSIADLLTRYQKLAEDLQNLVTKLDGLTMNGFEKLLNRVEKGYSAHKEWLEPLLAASLIGTCFWKSKEIREFVDAHKLPFGILIASLYFLYGQKRSTIAGLKSKLPATLYHPLAFLKWLVGSREKAIRASLPYGTNINVAKLKAWATQQEALCGMPVVFDEDKNYAPGGFGSIARLLGLKTEIKPLLGIELSPEGVKGNLAFWPF